MPFVQTGEGPGDYYVFFTVQADGAAVEFETRHVGSAFPTEDQRNQAIQKIADMLSSNQDVVYFLATKGHITSYEVTPNP